MRVLVVVTVLAGVAVCPAQDGKQDPKREIDLTWKLSHDKAALYDVWDVARKSRRGEFWLLGCELETRVGAMDSTDLPYRFVFRLPKRTVRVGDKWDALELAFADDPKQLDSSGIQPIQVVGAWRLKSIKDTRLDEVLRSAARGVRLEPQLLAEVQGQFNLTRYRQQDGKWVAAESKPSANLSTTAYVRVSDGAVIGARWQWSGRSETYRDLFSSASAKSEDICELTLRDGFKELSKTGLKERIDSAVRNGVKWLKSQQARDGKISDGGNYGGLCAGTGSTSLCVLALLHSGVSPDDPVVKAAFASVAAFKGQQQTYDVGILLMALEAKYLPMEKWEEIEQITEEKAREAISAKVSKEDKALAESNARWLMTTQAANGAFGYWDSKESVNLSNTQYALLGLKSASRLGISVPDSVWKRALHFIDGAAQSDGAKYTLQIVHRSGKPEERNAVIYGWQYLPPTWTEVTGTMVVAALSSMAVCRSELARQGEWSEVQARRTEELTWGGLAWLDKFHAIRSGSPEGAWHLAAMPYFYLHGLERAGILLEVQRIGQHDWYFEGAAVLVSWQAEDGHWPSPQRVPVIDSALALLFLKRATLPVQTPTSRKDP